METKPDERLLEMRDVMRVEVEDGGFAVTLSCGHVIWCAVMPIERSHCGQCLDDLIAQIRGVRARKSCL